MTTEELKWSLIEECIKRGLDDGVEELVILLKKNHDSTDDKKRRAVITQAIYYVVDAHLLPRSEVENNE
jgi:hypothetical protein